MSDSVAEWRIVFSPHAARVWRKLPPKVRESVSKKIDWLAENMHTIRHEKLTDRDEYSLHASQYRILYEYNTEARVIHVETIGKHDEAYR
ncbi:MAG: hypothetical protein AUJ92_21835 [Armatimonadetes bacterium CG2_30_59_28]|nr:type II toxin-antitoxin system RelE/ParE family toxin [Armatimonadota bacterium]OIO89292.1 MAG: hypothetical protein AUJ92_21835 [Armatimonadetes bacterium CG2_30_59_28]PIU62686.1 MAG: hypothetical protein COS85_17800 [Armatimonadetes bacterium CG07_land_8_20_14_0_80_59_28]PIX46009.1 MAG: hypothetical protein COZ56_00530 [Armatimonadetes bacterium CG_4_8_14_3_um_filter_58_9]PIY41951.1 MAG: hypothetical protein COZ05_14780 [Armatimonadetes bacterium CG_4_10_14_3_um_filter_59_10]